MDEQFNRECLEEHNRLRALHGCPPLELDVELAQNAQTHSEKMASKNVMHHCLSQGHGENLCIREGSQPTHIDGKQATLRWYGEITKFNFGEEKQRMSGNFSQIVWKDTQRVGFGRTIKDGGCRIYIVAYYAPCGNVTGHFTENVPRPLSGEIYIPTDAEKGW
ncbi:Golgi-associated plant pathoproteinsis- protein 1 [Clonorchis sinensis]|uniref:Golgi-associated plant pathogenesis-related protein 1 n=2 Tax=Clonorchis sinensis TaxID=79923 RepID=G7YWP4_CLOSI|nr:Golgi-associated plant pathoproteinsis- protein 1 [Clonorchis sinensis]GAA57374.1 Golgi-associated plant pathogenesis-related protein 1 [Clonorchis sinensis]